MSHRGGRQAIRRHYSLEQAAPGSEYLEVSYVTPDGNVFVLGRDRLGPGHARNTNQVMGAVGGFGSVTGALLDLTVCACLTLTDVTCSGKRGGGLDLRLAVLRVLSLTENILPPLVTPLRVERGCTMQTQSSSGL
ncbi:hypothetical protein Cadr_000012155 [Camelus dromedarius]|uniref:Uncharacterized protein n=1 Tax=Camelus dromedarius TaxID=9838 RepID=A0A5N4DUL7_CAMDR|nr:hypothetical protein Cadr_000012155 [Camelus dromedarius]